MNLSVPILIIAIILFVLSTIPPLARGWMLAIGLALMAASMLPYFSLHLTGR
jgi:hypothetical protein